MYDHTVTGRVLCEVGYERVRQEGKWGEQNHPDGTGGVAFDIEAKLARGVCDQAAARGDLTWRHIAEEEMCEASAETDPTKLRAELVQLAAVATAWIEAIDRREANRERARQDSTPNESA